MTNNAKTAREIQSSWQATIARVAGCATAAIAAFLAITTTVSGEAHSALTLLFGWERLLAVQILFAMPICFLLARRLLNSARKQPGDDAAGMLLGPLLWALTGFGMGVVVIVLAPHVIESTCRDADFAARCIIRFLLCAALAIPWCIAGESLAVRYERQPITTGLHTWWATPWCAGVAFVAAVALPAAYAVDLGRREAARATDLLARPQLLQAQQIVQALVASGCPAIVSGMTPQEADTALKARIRAIEKLLKQPPPAADDVQRCCERAAALAMLDRPDEALEVIAPHIAHHASAAILAGSILQKQQRFAESSQAYETAVRMLRAEPESSRTVAGVVLAIDQLAFNAREQGEYARAQAYYEAGMAELPAAAAHFHFQLGKHHQLGGRPAAAVEHLQTAARLAPQEYAGQATKLLDELSRNTPGCVLKSSPGR